MKELLVITSFPQDFTNFDKDFGGQYHLTLVDDPSLGYQKFSERGYDIGLIDVEMLPLKNLEHLTREETLKHLRELRPEVPILLLNHSKTDEEWPTLISQLNGAYLSAPFTMSEVKVLCDRLLNEQLRSAEIKYLRDQFWDPDSLPLVSSQNPKMVQIFENLKSVAPTRSTVLILGETGVGKSAFARLIHEHSNRKNKPFIHVHCGAITETLLESELFGHEKGSFTGAIKRKLGKFELANGGTIFLDEVSTLTKSAQVKLLQVLQNNCFQRVGGETEVKVDIRVIAATNDDLEGLANEGEFRKDLFYRLNVFPVHIPPLRDRPEDVERIIAELIQQMNPIHGKSVRGVQQDVLAALKSYPWPGNVRELENLVERAFIIEKSDKLCAESFPTDLVADQTPAALLPLNIKLPLAEARLQMIEDFERQYLKELLVQTQGKINQAAELAGIGVRQLNKLMNKYKLDKKDFKDSQNSLSH
ncbi:MAG: sigma-54-dependent Fis family transcriptional regulator [Bdellovibrionales bacterium]|nr:sigma-54-dependent Fis family transcriptional regulator [Bdellovibrionales bacterium]